VDYDTSGTNPVQWSGRRSLDCDSDAFQLCREPTHRNAGDVWQWDSGTCLYRTALPGILELAKRDVQRPTNKCPPSS